MVIPSIPEYFRYFISFAILVAIVSMFLVLSCHSESIQFNNGFGYHPSPDSCEEHIGQPRDVHTNKSIFDSVSLPEGKALIAAIFVATFFFLFPTLPERYNRSARIALNYHQRKRWVWARHTPFSSTAFFPYLAAQRDP